MKEPSAIGILDPDDCPQCRSAGSVYGDVCEVCLADLGEHGRAPVEKRGSIRLVDLLDEMETLSVLAARQEHTVDLALAGGRVKDLLEELRRQFVQEAILGAHDRPTPVR
jgi:hypothetical protein